MARSTPSAATLVTTLIFLLALPAAGQLPTAPEAGTPGGDLFEASCAECHTIAGEGRAPGTMLLSQMSPRAIVAALEDGVMRDEGSELSAEQRILLAEYLSQREYTKELLPEAAFCSDRGFRDLDLGAIGWMGFGGDLAGTGFQPTDRAGLEASDVPQLELKWAFAFPDAAQARTKPTVVGDVLLVGGQFGEVFALDAETGCVRWSFEAESGVRGAVLVGEGERGQAVAYFMDFRTNAYALDVTDGTLLWKTRVGWHATSSNTGSPVLHDGKLIVPISSMEVLTSGDPRYECCTASGAVAAVDVRSGEVIWYHRVIPGHPEEAGTNSLGTQLWAPSGAPVWSSPTVDAGRGLVYVGTGENYTRPATETSDAILAVDLESGELAWSFQGTEGDAWVMACMSMMARQNCPSPPGPDLDFGMAPILVERPDGKEILVAGQKSGTVWALDPDADGAVLWSTQIGKGSALGGIHWGMATDGRYVFAANADRPEIIVDVNPDIPSSPGLFALDLMTGEVVWSVPASPAVCENRPGCFPSNSAAPTVIPGVVFAAGIDGFIRAHATEDGSLLWEFDTTTVTEAVGGVTARGGSIDGPGPVVAGGRLYVNSGYGTFNQMSGNLLLAFGPRGGR